MFKDVGHYVYGRICIRLAKEHHIRNSNKKPLYGPDYRLVNAVKLSLQSGRNTQIRTYSGYYWLLSEHHSRNRFQPQKPAIFTI